MVKTGFEERKKTDDIVFFRFLKNPVEIPQMTELSIYEFIVN